MKTNNIIMKCCVCERVKTDQGWDHRFMPLDENRVVSHGYCPLCYLEALRAIDDMQPQVFEIEQALALAR